MRKIRPQFLYHNVSAKGPTVIKTFSLEFEILKTKKYSISQKVSRGYSILLKIVLVNGRPVFLI